MPKYDFHNQMEPHEFQRFAVDIIDTREKLKRDNKNFEYAQGDLVDYYTYQIKANQAKLDYLIKLAKTNGIQVDMVNDKKFTFSESEEAG